jgi:large subunit ribosomal protein L22
MVSRAVLKYARLSPRKFRLIIPLVKGKGALEAIAILYAVKKKASGYGIELLKSAIANAKRKVQGIDTSTLYISRLVADPGPMLKRFRAASMGRAASIHKHTSHITIELDEIKQSPAKEEKDTKIQRDKDTKIQIDKETRSPGHKVAGATKKSKAKAAAKQGK